MHKLSCLPLVMTGIVAILGACTSAVPAPSPAPTGAAPTPTVAAPAAAPSPTPAVAAPTPQPAPALPPALPSATPTPLPSPTPPAGVIRRLTDEQLQAELRRVRFSTREWPRTDFRVHSVPLTEFRGGGPGRDDIPPIDSPRFVTVQEADGWLKDREPVQVVEIGGDARAYPLQVLIWHEVVNDTVGGEPVTVTY